MNENLSYTGQRLTESFEGCALVPYQDQTGVWTGGYGNTHNVIPGMPITQAQAELDLNRNIAWAVIAVQKMVEIVLTQGEFDALVDFVFNVGSGNFAKSTLLTDLNDGKIEEAAQQFTLWDLAGGNVVAGLLRRRVAEQAEFNGDAP